jgi:phage-related tail fiber protein
MNDLFGFELQDASNPQNLLPGEVGIDHNTGNLVYKKYDGTIILTDIAGLTTKINSYDSNLTNLNNEVTKFNTYFGKIYDPVGNILISNNYLKFGTASAIKYDTVNKIAKFITYTGTTEVAAKFDDADKVDGYHAANTTGAIPISNGVMNINLNAEMLGGLKTADYNKKIEIFNSNYKKYTDLCQFQDQRDNTTIGKKILKITLPFSWNTTMLGMEIVGNNYSLGGNWTLKLFGYNYATDILWKNVYAEGSRLPFKKVRFAHDGTKCCILLGDEVSPTYDWIYPFINIETAYACHSGAVTTLTGTTMSWISDLTGMTGIVEPVINAGTSTNLIDGLAKSIDSLGNTIVARDATGNMRTATDLLFGTGTTGNSIGFSGSVYKAWIGGVEGKFNKAVDTDTINGYSQAVAATQNTLVRRDANGNITIGSAVIMGSTIKMSVDDTTKLITLKNQTDGLVNTAYLFDKANTAVTLATSRAIAISGDMTGTANFDGSASINIVGTLKNVGTPGTYRSVTTDTQGRVTAGTNPTTIAQYGLTDAVNTSEVVTTATANKILKLDGSSKLPASITGNADGNAATATKLQTSRNIAITGDIAWNVNFDGSANVTGVSTLANVATAGTYRSVTINAKGLVTSGTNPTTLAGYGLIDATPFATLSGTTPATLGWYRIATSAVGIGMNSSLVKIDFSGSGVKGSTLFRASCHDGFDIGSGINQIGFTTTNSTLGLTQIRVVYHNTPAANYAYIEAYNPTALAITYVVDLIDSTGWVLTNPATVGSIPAGYVTKSLTLDTGIVSGEDVTATKQIRSNIITGTAPLVVLSTTKVTNLNVDMVDDMHVSVTNTANTIVARDASGNINVGTITGSIAGNASTATKLETARSISITGDMTWSVSFDGSANVTAVGTLANTGVAASTYRSVTVDAKGRVTGGTNPTTIAQYGLTDAVNTSDVVTTAAANKILKLDGTGLLPTGVTGNAGSATKLATARSITLDGDVSGTTSFDGSGNVTMTTTVADDSHLHDGRYYTETESDARFVNIVEGTNILSYDRVAEYADGISNQTGVFKITLPNSWTHTMLMIELNIYEFSSNGYAKVLIGGINHSVSSSWTNTSVRIIGSLQSNRVRLAHDGTKCCILIGDVSSIWQFPKIVISSVHASYTNQNLWGTGWSIGLITSESGITTSAEPVVNAGVSASTATILQTARAIAIDGDMTGTANFDGSANISITGTLANSGVTAGTYRSVTVDAKGRVTTGTNPTTLAQYGITDSIILAADVVTTATANKILRLDASAKLPANITGNADGNAATATKLAIARNIAITGDLTWNLNFDGSANVTAVGTLANTGVVASTYRSVTVDAKGRVTGGTNPTTLAGYGITDSIILASDVVTVATANKILKLDGNSKLPANITGNADGNAATATKLATARSITLDGDVSGTTSFDGSGNVTMTTTVADDSHLHDGRYYTEAETDGRFVHKIEGSSILTYDRVCELEVNNASPRGMLKITLPKTWSSTVLQLDIDIYNYGTATGYSKVYLGGFVNTSTWTNTSAKILGALPTNQVRFAHDGTKCCIIIGNVDTLWDSPKIIINKVHTSYSNETGWDTGWSMSITATDVGVTMIAEPVINVGLNSATATALQTARNIALTGGVTGNANFDGSGNISIAATVTNDSHTHDGRYYTETESDGRFLNLSEVVTVATANKVLKLDANSKLPASITGNADGNAATATKLATARVLSISGDMTGTVNFDGSANANIVGTLANTGVTAGAYAYVTINSKGLVTAANNSPKVDDITIKNKVTLNWNATTNCLEYLFI